MPQESINTFRLRYIYCKIIRANGEPPHQNCSCNCCNCGADGISWWSSWSWRCHYRYAVGKRVGDVTHPLNLFFKRNAGYDKYSGAFFLSYNFEHVIWPWLGWRVRVDVSEEDLSLRHAFDLRKILKGKLFSEDNAIKAKAVLFPLRN